MPADVVGAWRRQPVQTARQGWCCSACGRIYLVRRLRCPGCEGVDTLERGALPRRATAVAVCRAGGRVEHLDQTTGRKPAVLLEHEAGHLTCLVTATDDALDLRGELLRVVVRRIPLGALPPDEPIPYGIKAAADLSTRLRLKAEQKEKDD